MKVKKKLKSITNSQLPLTDEDLEIEMQINWKLQLRSYD